MRRGTIFDIYWDYTGTGLLNYKGLEPIAEKQQVYEAIQEVDAENGIIWTSIFDVNNLYTLVIRYEHVEELCIETISGLPEDYIK
ncbi:hypothetical protein [Radiobacillus sp. PE A8.2]|uniref:hypothetical protein n=1 Tax=Radiobacillus sp. PE A8.2 TaxID=3380349 RepID=UPI00388FF541